MFINPEATSPTHEENAIQLPHTVESDTQRLYDREDRRKRVITKVIATCAILDSLYMSLYKLPIEAEQERLSHTHSSISEALEPSTSAPRDATTVVLGGFGTRDSQPIALALSPLRQLGEVDSILENNNGISAENLAHDIMAHSLARGTTSVGLWGDSLGGPILADVARIIQQSDTPLHVAFIVLDCSPTSFNSLRPDKQKTIQSLDFWSNLLPDLPYHPAVNYFYTSSQMGESPLYAASGVHGGAIIDKMNDVETPSPALLESQVAFVINPNLEDNLAAISKVITKQPPIVISIRPTSSTGDAVINSPVATNELATMMKKTNLEYDPLMINGISHGDPTANRESYDETLRHVILPLLRTRRVLITPPNDGQLAYASDPFIQRTVTPYEVPRLDQAWQPSEQEGFPR